MLTPDYLESLPEPVVKLWQQVEDDILRDIARRIGKMDGMTETADFQLWRLEEIRTLRKSVTSTLAKYSGKTEQEIRELLQAAGKIALDGDDAVYAAAGYTPGPLNDSVALLNLLNAGYAQTMGTWDNLTATTADTVTREFEHALDRAWLQVSSGAFDYKTAIKRAVDGLAQHMPGVTYPSGHHDTLEVAVRRAVLTGVNQTASKLQLARMDEFAWDWVEVSAHSGARPEHAAWQGKLYHRGGAAVYQGKRYEDFETATGYGTGAGLCGWNCRHTFFASSPDNPPAWSMEELAALSEKTINYNGKQYTKYEISQMQRDLERKVRSAKRKYMAEAEAGVDATRAAVELKTRREDLKHFIAETHRRMDSSRTSVSGFGHSAAAKATATHKRFENKQQMLNAFKETMENAGYTIKGFSNYTGDGKTLAEMQKAYVQLAKIYPNEAKGLTIEYAYDKDPDTFGWYDKKSRTISFNEQMYCDYKKLSQEYDKLVNTGHFPVGTDCRSGFYHEFGHAWGDAHGNGSYRKATDKVLYAMGYGRVNVAQREQALMKELSIYATTTTAPAYQEVIAEAFSEWYNSDTPRQFCKEFLKEVGAIV